MALISILQPAGAALSWWCYVRKSVTGRPLLVSEGVLSILFCRETRLNFSENRYAFKRLDYILYFFKKDAYFGHIVTCRGCAFGLDGWIYYTPSS